MPAAAVDKRQRIMQIREVMTVLFLAVMGWKDWKKKEISLLLTGTYGIIGLAFSIYAERPLEDWLLPFWCEPDDTGGKCSDRWRDWNGRWLDFSGTRNNAAYRNVCKNGMYRNVDRSGVCGSPSGYMQKRTQDRNSTGAFLTVWIAGRIIAMKVRKGSFTIEAACVMSLVLITVMGVLYLSFFVHNRSWLTAAAYEAALAGSIEGVQKNGQIYEAASAKAQELGNVGFFGAENLSYQVSDGKTVKVSYQADTIAGFGGFRWVLRTEGSSKIIRPAQWIRKVKAASEIVKDTE